MKFSPAMICSLASCLVVLVPSLARGVDAPQKSRLATDDWRSQGILYLAHSENARMQPVPVQAVHLNDGFWYARRKAITDRSIPTMLALLEEHGVFDNFRRLSGRKNVPRRGPLYTDSDGYKWIEAAAWAIASNETPDGDKARLRSQVEGLISDVIAAQESSGYLNTFYVGDKVRFRFTELTRSHEDYCLGHLIQAAIAWYRATGNRNLLDCSVRFANYIVDNFGPEPKRPFLTGHPELEMAMVELYRTTGDTRYLEFTRYLFSGIEKDRLRLKDSEIRYTFSGRPFTSRTEFEGHAVRALYAASGATDYFTESGDPAFKKTLDSLWKDLTARKMYITGGVGSRASGESFGDSYELPNEQAYAETCASIANFMWNFRMLAVTGQAPYMDVAERALFNGVNSGVSLAGTLYCYRNPLASSGNMPRNPWYDTTCCPPNIERLFEALPGYFYGTGRNSIYVNLYGASELDWHLDSGTPVKVTQSTNYPWAGDVQFTVNPAKASDFTLYLRYPAWANSVDISVNGQPVSMGTAEKGSYIALTRKWKTGDTVTLNLPTPIVPTSANPRVSDDYGKIALQRGPLVYALEQIDQGGVTLGDLAIRSLQGSTTELKKDLLGGIILLKVPGSLTEKSSVEEPLYSPVAVANGRARKPVTLTFVPFYSVGNREGSPLEVWVPFAKSDTVIGGQSGATDRRDFLK